MPDIRVRIGSQNRIKVTSSISGSSSMSLAELSDMNITGPSEGMVLVYNASTNKWEQHRILISTEVAFNGK